MDHRFPLFIVDCTCTEFYVFIGTIFHFIVRVSITVFNPTTLVSVSIYHFNHFRPNILSSFKYFLKIVKQDKCPKHSESSKLLFPAYYCVQHIIMSSNVFFQAKYCVHTCFYFNTHLLNFPLSIFWGRMHSPLFYFLCESKIQYGQHRISLYIRPKGNTN